MRCHQSVRSHKRTSCGRVGRGIAGASTAFAAIAAAARFAGFAREEGALCGRCWLRSDTAAGGDAAGAECAAEVLGMHGIQGGLCAPQSMSIRSAWKTSSKARQSPPASRDERGMGRAQAYPRLRGKL
jgi:hypothetical protein